MKTWTWRSYDLEHGQACRPRDLAAASMLMVNALFLSTFSSVAGEEIKESSVNEIGYATVAQALAALRTQPGVKISEQGGWTIATESKSATIWSFAPPGNPAYPSAVKRSLVVHDGATYVDMQVKCEASKAACDKLVTDFQQLNQKMAQYAQGGHAATPAVSAGPAPSAAQAGTPAPKINLTPDSAPGWLPSADQQAQVAKVTHDYLAALDAAQYQKAYDLLAADEKADEAFEPFSKRASEFNAKAGAPRERRILMITWSKDPANAPAPGVYSGVDLASRFENIDRHCGYIMLYQRDAGSPFLVMRRENNYMTNEDARQIALKQSPQAVEEMWKRLSAYCPNYAAAQAGASE